MIKNMKLFYIALLVTLVLPLASLAANEPITSQLEVPKKDEKKEEIRKQINDTVDICGSLINKIQSLAKRIAERKSILVSQDNLSKEAKESIDSKLKEMDEMLAGASDRTNNGLPKLGESLLGSSKPLKVMKDFRKEVNKIKIEIKTAHKLLIEIIDLIKKESSKPESKTSQTSDKADSMDEATTTTE